MINLSKPKHLFLLGLGYSLFLFTLLVLTRFFPEEAFILGTNKTIGSAYDFVIGSAVFFIGSQIIAVVGYGFMWLFNCRVNSRISVFHCFIILLILLVIFIERNDEYSIVTIAGSLLVVAIAVINASFAMYYKMSNKKQRIHN